MVKLRINYLHLKYCDILFDDLKTREIVKFLMLSYEPNWNFNNYAAIPVKIDLIASKTGIKKRTLQRQMNKLEDCYKLVHRVSGHKRTFLPLTYSKCLTQLEKLSERQRQDFIYLFKRHGADCALEYVDALTFKPRLTTPRRPSLIIAKKRYKNLSESVRKYIKENVFDGIFIYPFANRTKEEYMQFKYSAYNGELDKYVGVDDFWSSILKYLSLIIKELTIRSLRTTAK